MRLTLEGRVEGAEETDLLLANIGHFPFELSVVEKEAVAGDLDLLLRELLRCLGGGRQGVRPHGGYHYDGLCFVRISK